MNLIIKEILVVEGKNDTNVLQSYFDCDTIETHGTHIGNSVLSQIAYAQKKRGVIIFTDPDYPGEKIRTTINRYIPGCKNAFIEKAKAKTTKKVGIEHASKEDLQEALCHLLTYQEDMIETISQDEFCRLGLNGQVDSAKKRERIAYQLFLGKPNAKTLRKRLNMLQLTFTDVEKLLQEQEV